MIGFDASGHIAEETRHAKYVMPRTVPSIESLVDIEL